MTEATIEAMQFRQAKSSAVRVRRRYAAERRFRFYGVLAISLAILMLALLLYSIVSKGYGAFVQTEIALEIHFDPAVIDPEGKRDPAVLAAADYARLIKEALYAQFPEATSRGDKRDLYGLVSTGSSFELQKLVRDDPTLIGKTQRVTLLAADDFDMLHKGHVSRGGAEADRRLNDKQVAWFDALAAKGLVSTAWAPPS